MHHCNIGIGTLIEHRYELARPIAQGGMAVVYQARDTKLDRRVAVEIVHPASNYAELATRTILASRKMARLVSPHVTQVLDIGSTPDGCPFVVMEYLEGLNVADLIETEGKLSADFVLDVACQLCEALSSAHQGGGVHRDLRPEHLALVERPSRPDPFLKLLGVGVAERSCALFENPNVITSEDIRPAFYLAPEQIRSPEHLDERTNVWAVGIIIYEMLTGHVPFSGESTAEVFQNILTGNYVPLQFVDERLPPSLGALVDACLQLDENDRPSSAASLGAMLREALGRSHRGAPFMDFATKTAERPSHAAFPLLPIAGQPTESMMKRQSSSTSPVLALAALSLMLSLPWLEPGRVQKDLAWLEQRVESGWGPDPADSVDERQEDRAAAPEFKWIEETSELTALR